MQRRRATLLTGATVALVVAATGAQAATAPAAPAATTPATAASAVSAADLADIGRLVVVDLPGTRLDAATRTLLSHDHVGGVLLFGRNIASPVQVIALDAQIHTAAAGEKTLVMTDQEGGTVRRLAFAPPTASASLAGRAGPHAVQTLMAAAGNSLHLLGVDVDLAPVSDTTGGFLGSRSYGRSPAADVSAAVRGLQSGHVDATAKHFPGLGGVRTSTDDGPATGSRVSGAGLAPFVAAARAGVRLVMIDLASHPGLGHGPAALQPATYALLHGPKVGYRGATITDALDAGAVRRPGEVTAAVQAVAAGADLVLVPGGATMARRVLAALTQAVRDHTISPARYLAALTSARNVESARR